MIPSKDPLSLVTFKSLRKVYRRRHKAQAREQFFRKIFAKNKHYTMISEGDYIKNLELAETHLRQNRLDNGCVVECGTWRGGMSFGLVEALPQIQEFHCFDSFQGLPKVGPLDGECARRMQEEGKFVAVNNYASVEEFNAGLRQLDALRQSRVHVHAGWFSETMTGFRPSRPISLLRIDCDWYDSVTMALDVLFDHVQTNGLIIIDDYMSWEGCSRAVHDFLSKRQARERIQQTAPGAISFLIKDFPPT